MLARPVSGSDIDFDDWRILGTEVVIVGRLLPQSADEFTIQFQVFDVLRGEQLLGFRQPARRSQLRAASHRVADLIYEELTGVPGVFGTQIAYVTVTGPASDRVYRLIVADADGENDRVVAESASPLMSPAWSPDSRKLAYVSFENNRSEVYVQTLRSGARARVSSRPGVNGAPAWSPDGRQLALTLSRDDGNLDIYLTANGTNALLQGDGAGGFTDVTEGALGHGGDSIGAAWADYDEDGDLDLYCANASLENALLRNNAPGTHHWLHLDLTGSQVNRSGIGARVRVVAGFRRWLSRGQGGPCHGLSRGA